MQGSDLVYFEPQHHEFVDFPSTAPDADPEQVVVAGAGPVGLAVALGLARRGVTVTLLEAGDSVSYGSRAICLSRHSLEVLDRLGVGAEFDRLSLPWTKGRSHYRDTEVLAFSMPHGVDDVRVPMVNISQSVAEQILLDAVVKDPHIRLHWRSEVTAVTQDDDQVTVTAQTPEGTRTLRARHLVASDGAHSAVRKVLGVHLEGTSYEGRYVIADIHWESELPAERQVWFDPPSNPGSTIILHRQPDDIWRVDYQLTPGEDADLETREDRIRERISRHLNWLGNTRPWTLEWSSLYRAHARALESFLHGRVLFAGDAAHLVPIFGVRGLNSGLEDADVYAWALAAVARGEAGPQLLRTVADERRDAWRQNVEQAEKSTLFMTPGTDGYRLTRDGILQLALRRPVLRHLIDPRQSSATHSRGSSLTLPATSTAVGPGPGDPLPDLRVRPCGGAATGLHALRGATFTLVAAGAPAETARAARELSAAPGAGLAVTAIATSGRPIDGVTVLEGDAVAERLGLADGEALLVRPDGLVLARLRLDAPLAPLTRHLTDQLAAGGVR
ncbi:FAD-dependent monooxygenase [Streptomyces sp. KR55]|uniref:FAD-dependent monooxygenase n=1 Tax=Streptomyces sp. KR55 TaxID=3457425 RepID=UPI003FD244C1